MTVEILSIKLPQALLLERKLCMVAFVVLFISSCVVQDSTALKPPLAGDGEPPTVRRLTESQYRQSIADIFGTAIKIPGPFEPDIRRDGLLAVGSSEVAVTRSGFERYDQLARNIAAQAISKEHRRRLFACVPASLDAEDMKCTTQILGRYGRLLHRRPLDPGRLEVYVQTAGAETQRLGNYYEGLSFALAGMLVAPEFLFRIDVAEPDPENTGRKRLDGYSKASRLSFFLWNTTPGDTLLLAASRGELNTKSGLTTHVDRMLESSRLKNGVRAFFSDMLEFESIKSLSKDGTIFPRFSRSVMRDAEEQTLHTIIDHLVVRNGDYRDLFTTRQTFMTRNLGILYRVPVAVEEGWEPYEFSEEDGRVGLMTQISFLALHGPPGRSSPTLRGMAVRELLMCQNIPAPPGNVDFSAFEADNAAHSITVRDRLSVHRSNPVCAGCHKIMDPIGLALENFDGLGQYRKTENGAEIDTSGELDGYKYQDSKGLGRALRESPATVSCLVNNVYRYATGRGVRDAEKQWLTWLEDSFAKTGYRIPSLLRQISTSDTFFAVSTYGVDKKPNALIEAGRN